MAAVPSLQKLCLSSILRGLSEQDSAPHHALGFCSPLPDFFIGLLLEASSELPCGLCDGVLSGLLGPRLMALDLSGQGALTGVSGRFLEAVKPVHFSGLRSLCGESPQKTDFRFTAQLSLHRTGTNSHYPFLICYPIYPLACAHPCPVWLTNLATIIRAPHPPPPPSKPPLQLIFPAAVPST